MTDGQGVPLAARVTAGQAHESTQFEALMDQVHVGRRRRPEAVAGDKAYSAPRIREWCKRRRIEAVIPPRRDELNYKTRPAPVYDESKYRRRNVVERCIGWLKYCRRVGTRYEKLASHFLAMVKLAMIQRCLRLFDPSDRT